ncbi:MAG: sporulation-delaying protein SdpB family protein [Bacteroidota bacterium]
MLNKILNSNTITLCRALLALSLLVTLVFTGINDLFPKEHILEVASRDLFLMKLNFFLWFNSPQLPYIFSIIILIFSILGVYPRFFCVLQCWVTYSLFYSMLIIEGGDQINTILTFLLIPVCILDDRKNGWVVKREVVLSSNNKAWLFNAIIILYIIKLQVSMLYFNAGIAKIYGSEWSNGTAVYYWFNDNIFGAPNWLKSVFGPLFRNGICVSLINWSIIFIEISIFVALFLKQELKYLLFFIGFSLHFLIIFIHGLPAFGMVMTACLILYLFRLDISIIDNINELKKISFKKLFYERISRIN